jgi:glycosyltransferase involved in cell wall biosynthesis
MSWRQQIPLMENSNSRERIVRSPIQRPVPVLLTVRELNYGGIEHDVAKVALHIDRSRYEPHVASYHAKGVRYLELRNGGIPLLHVPVTSLKSLKAAVSAARFCRYIQQHKIRVVHSYDASAVFAVPLARAMRVPAVVSSQLGSRDLLDQRTRKQLRWTDRHVDAVVVNCAAMRHHLVADEGVPTERIEICYNGVDTREFFPQGSRKLGPGLEDSLVVGTLCVLRPEKALDVLQEAFSRISRVGPKLKLLVAGDGPELPKLQMNSLRLGLQDVSVFLPATSQVANLLHSIDIFVLPSHSEAFSNALLEAMACGCCVVGSQVGGTPELIGNDERGLLFRAGDPGDLAVKLSRLIFDPALRNQLASRAVDFAKNQLSVEKNAQRTAEIYDQILRRRYATGTQR